MKIDGLLITECNSSQVLMSLYNQWIEATRFLSTGNDFGPAWLSLIYYGEDHPVEAIKFGLEYLQDIGSNWRILGFIDQTIGCPINHHLNSDYIDPNSEDVKLAYQVYLTLEINEPK